jgi:hypothetical protein
MSSSSKKRKREEFHEVLVKVDKQEHCKQLFVDKNTEHVRYEIADIKPGDYEFHVDGVIELVLERKALDLIPAVHGGRLDEQKGRLMGVYPPHKRGYLFQGVDQQCYAVPGLVPTSTARKVFSVLIHCTYRDGIPIWMVPNGPPKDRECYVASLIAMFADKFMRHGIKWRDEKKSAEELQHEGMMRQMEPSRKMNLTSQGVFEAMLRCVPGVKQSAKDILAVYPSLAVFYKQLDKLDTETRIDKIASIQRLKTTRKLGTKLAIMINSCFFCSDKLQDDIGSLDESVPP